ncbi:hypothetical protein JQ633_01670 [Bradyrhizobium tropiciagri]|uniref:hypothetical protein n=1 Tax=Bradyrhizobium tropiciagri TaxID=312253 RepID=UPI001BA8751E|nr:hypothetical protein [Bradyrhizobium tropiciagri]MBR0869048.1 hypothetical protein [Bradyrhizobium tropiciagri]
MTKSLEIEIALDDLEFLTIHHYRLCIAAIASDGNAVVVWRSFDHYLANNSFSLASHFEVFGTSSLAIGSVVSIDTGTMAIAPGQQTTLTADAFLPPVAGRDTASITIDNQYPRPIHLGVSRALTGPDKVAQTTPVFVSQAALNGRDVFSYTPRERLRVWFQENVVTGTMLDRETLANGPNAIEVDLSASKTPSLRYENGMWSAAG